ncbi:MAG: hypothetical protein K2R98_20805 [Gemmataceae bacterium]|nr:hypothetical protein [Gemmataceae bacterium]
MQSASGGGDKVARRDFLKISGTLLGGLAGAGGSVLARATITAAENAATPVGCELRKGDVVALCGDSITSAGHYPSFLEAYQLDGPLKDATLAEEAKALQGIIDKFKSLVGRTVILGSPGCVDTPLSSSTIRSPARLEKSWRR